MKTGELIWIFVIVIILIVVGILVSSALNSTNKITNFEECVKAGNPILETLPLTCQAKGETFTEEEKIITGLPCESDELNCNNFKSRLIAQDLFEACGGIGFDVHNLDPDENGLACEDFDYG